MAIFVVASPARAVISGDWEYLVIGGNATIIKYLGSATNIVVPNTIDGRSVTDIRGPASYQSVFTNYPTSVQLPTTLTNIGSYSFYLSYNLTNVNIPNGVKSIGEMAFHSSGIWRLNSFTSITIPTSVTNISQYAFSNCNFLASITIPDSVTTIGDYSFQSCNNLTNAVIGNAITNLPAYLFAFCSKLANVNIPSGVTTIGGSSFRSTALTNVTIPNSVKSIGDHAFNQCTSLTSINIPNSVTTISWRAFNECYSVTNVIVGTGVSYLGDRAFGWMPSLMRITFLGNAPSLDSSGTPDPFYDTPSFTLFYTQGTTGWGSTFAGRQTTLSGNFSLTLASDPTKGAVTNSPSGNSFSSGTSVSVSAIAVAGYAFTAWSGDSTSTNNPLVLVMNTNKAVTANFGPDNGDTDMDGLSNYQEVIVFNTNPNQPETNSPVAGLYLASQKQAERAAGQNDVINNPLQYGLFTTAQIELGMFGGVLLSRTNNHFVLNYHILRSSDLQNWTPFQTNSVVIDVENTNKMFFQLMPIMTSPASELPPL